jgi:sulfatase maturation enzyme AslB (radical SAM superfamily)
MGPVCPTVSLMFLISVMPRSPGIAAPGSNSPQWPLQPTPVRPMMKVRHLEITTMIGCKVACVYCPQDKISHRYFGTDRMMKFEDFKIYIEKVPRRVVVHFTGFAEPFLNPQCTEMIEYAARRGHLIYISTTLAGMTREDIRRLSKLAYYQFQIHLPSAEKLMNLKIDDEYFSLLSDLVSAGIITDLHFHGNEVHPLVGAWLRQHAVNFEEFWIQDRAGNLNTEKVKKKVSKAVITTAKPNGKLRCDRVNINVLLPNGDVVLCCMDWSAEYVLGNLKRDQFDDLYRSETFRRVLRGLREPGSDILCRTCHVAQSAEIKDRLKTVIHNIPGAGPIAVQTLRQLKQGTKSLVHAAFRPGRAGASE